MKSARRKEKEALKVQVCTPTFGAVCGLLLLATNDTVAVLCN